MAIDFAALENEPAAAPQPSSGRPNIFDSIDPGAPGSGVQGPRANVFDSIDPGTPGAPILAPSPHRAAPIDFEALEKEPAPFDVDELMKYGPGRLPASN